MSDRPSTYQLLSVLRDARLEGREQDVALVLEEIGAGSHRLKRSAAWPAARPYLAREWLIDQLIDQSPIADALAEALEENRRERQRCIADQIRCGRMEWLPRRPRTLQDVYKQRYDLPR